ncbi:hypothetical protein FKN01_23735 [Streptomyces sp. 130]|nr:hypothetical protein FKN01_23735 [Streptomyces sp. 130]
MSLPHAQDECAAFGGRTPTAPGDLRIEAHGAAAPGPGGAHPSASRSRGEGARDAGSPFTRAAGRRGGRSTG